MAQLTLALSARTEVARDTMAFEFDLGGREFSFKPGQSLDLKIPDPPHRDDDGNERTFSIASAPGDALLMVATRMRDSAFKKSLAEISLGTKIEFTGPDGSFVLDPESDRPVILLAGGIGITPFRSMIKQAAESGATRSMTLVFSNHTPADAPFLDELRQWAERHDPLRLVATMTKPDDAKDWHGKTGLVGADFLKQEFENLTDCICYVAGPPGFVKGVSRSLQEAGVKTADVRRDEFGGY